MNDDFFAIYDALISGVDAQDRIEETIFGSRWGLCRSERGTGIAMATPVSSVAPMFPSGLRGLTREEAAEGIKSWDLTEATLSLAAVNSFYNTPERIAALNAFDGHMDFCTDGLDLRGMTVGFIGHLKMHRQIQEQAKEVYIIEREPQDGDYPDAACDYILPACDLVLISGSTLINKTLPHLLALCKNAYTILTGPSVPLCPGLFDFGVDRISGLAVTEDEAAAAHVREGRRGSPYHLGQSFTLSR